jgi:hypothetical protein
MKRKRNKKKKRTGKILGNGERLSINDAKAKIRGRKTIPNDTFPVDVK